MAMRRKTVVAPPSGEDADLARAAAQRIASLVHQGTAVAVQVPDAVQADGIRLPNAAVELLLEVLECMGSGRAVGIVPQDAELTMQQAADMLDVSRSCLNRLLRERKIPYVRVGAQSRVRLEDVLRYRNDVGAERPKAIEAFASGGHTSGTSQ